MASPFSGVRVELSPSLDLWMQGARNGTIQKITHSLEHGPIAIVRVDGVRKLQRIKLTDLSARIRHLIGPRGVAGSPYLITGVRVYFLECASERVKVTPEVPPSTLVFWINPTDLEGT
jgi:hypothetical protein